MLIILSLIAVLLFFKLLIDCFENLESPKTLVGILSWLLFLLAFILLIKSAISLIGFLFIL